MAYVIFYLRHWKISATNNYPHDCCKDFYTFPVYQIWYPHHRLSITVWSWLKYWLCVDDAPVALYVLYDRKHLDSKFYQVSYSNYSTPPQVWVEKVNVAFLLPVKFLFWVDHFYEINVIDLCHRKLLNIPSSMGYKKAYFVLQKSINMYVNTYFIPTVSAIF